MMRWHGLSGALSVPSYHPHTRTLLRGARATPAVSPAGGKLALLCHGRTCPAVLVLSLNGLADKNARPQWHGLSGVLSVTSYHTHGHACGESVPPSTRGACASRNYAFDRHCPKLLPGSLAHRLSLSVTITSRLSGSQPATWTIAPRSLLALKPPVPTLTVFPAGSM